jgi:predicted RNA binding protein YcfA (HicA-like mRNA interferase family)
MGVDGIRSDKIFVLLRRKGYRCQRVCGSHYVFTKPSSSSIPVPVHGNKVRLDVFTCILKHIRINQDASGRSTRVRRDGGVKKGSPGATEASHWTSSSTLLTEPVSSKGNSRPAWREKDADKELAVLDGDEDFLAELKKEYLERVQNEKQMKRDQLESVLSEVHGLLVERKSGAARQMILDNELMFVRASDAAVGTGVLYNIYSYYYLIASRS